MELYLTKSSIFQDENINLGYFNHFKSPIITAFISTIPIKIFQDLKRLSQIKIDLGESLLIWYIHEKEKQNTISSWEIVDTKLILGWEEILYCYKFENLISIVCFKDDLIFKISKYEKGVKVSSIYLILSLDCHFTQKKLQCEEYYNNLNFEILKKSRKFHMFAKIISNYMKPYLTFHDALLLDG